MGLTLNIAAQTMKDAFQVESSKWTTQLLSCPTSQHHYMEDGVSKAWILEACTVG